MFHRLMKFLGRYRLISDRRTGADYLHRYYLLFRDRKWFPFNVTLHRVVKSDDPVFHDHPWPFMTIILKGGYYEWQPQFNSLGQKTGEFATWRGAGSVIFHKSTDYHYLEIDSDNPPTTLFFMGPQCRDWGFLVENTQQRRLQWVPHDEYLSDWNDFHRQRMADLNPNK
jgi:hypothetical protein